MNSNSKKLSLKLSPETSKVLPFLIAAKKRGNPKEVEWATYEYECAQARARDRERWEREAQDRRERIEWERRLIEEEQEREYLAWREEQHKQQERLDKLGVHWALEDGWEEIQPTQSSQKGWRRLLSECSDLCESGRYGMWGGKRHMLHSNQKLWAAIRRPSKPHRKVKGKHNNGRKPRTPWFK